MKTWNFFIHNRIKVKVSWVLLHCNEKVTLCNNCTTALFDSVQNFPYPLWNVIHITQPIHYSARYKCTSVYLQFSKELDNGQQLNFQFWTWIDHNRYSCNILLKATFKLPTTSQNTYRQIWTLGFQWCYVWFRANGMR